MFRIKTKQKAEKRYLVYFSSGQENDEPKPCYRVGAKNRNEAYYKARTLLEKEYKVRGSPYFFIELLKTDLREATLTDLINWLNNNIPEED